MYLKLFYAFLIAVIASVQSATLFQGLFDERFNDEWELFKTKYNKQYENPLNEFFRRLVWQENVRNIQKHNMEHDMGRHSYRMGINEYIDLKPEEFRARFNGYKKKVNMTRESVHTFRYPLNVEYPEEIDWRTKGFVTPVKNQGNCGSCWAFSTTGSLEGQHFRATGKLISLSEQQLIDCSSSYGEYGCNGGLMDNGFNYIKDFGLESEHDYPYNANDNTCSYKKNNIAATCRGFIDIHQGNEEDLKAALTTVGPISVAIDASQNSFQFYNGGVYDEPNCSSTNLDHGVLVVGYGVENGKKYWLVKNSWGADWGLNGFIKMSRDKNNQCGIASSASFPVV